jgi:hypothetical protein
MTPAISTALTIHEPGTKEANSIRASILDDSWPAKVAALRQLRNLTKYNSAIPGLPAANEGNLHCHLLLGHVGTALKHQLHNNHVELITALLQTIYGSLNWLASFGLTPRQQLLLMEELHAAKLTEPLTDTEPNLEQQAAIGPLLQRFRDEAEQAAAKEKTHA